MTFNNEYTCRRNGSRGICTNALTVLSIALLLPSQCYGKSPLASIPTHHGINMDSLRLNERGGAVATRRRHWKDYYPAPPLPTRDALSKITAIASSVSTSSYSLKPEEKIKDTVNKGEEVVAESTKPAAAPSAANNEQKGQRQQEGLSPTAITCMSLLALQFGIQPILVRKYTPQTIVRSSVVLVQEIVKFGIAGTIYFSGTKKETREKDLEGEGGYTPCSYTGALLCHLSVS